MCSIKVQTNEDVSKFIPEVVIANGEARNCRKEAIKWSQLNQVQMTSNQDLMLNQVQMTSNHLCNSKRNDEQVQISQRSTKYEVKGARKKVFFNQMVEMDPILVFESKSQSIKREVIIQVLFYESNDQSEEGVAGLKIDSFKRKSGLLEKSESVQFQIFTDFRF